MNVAPDSATEVIPLWPDGPLTRIAGVPPVVASEVRTGVAAGATFLRNVPEPTLTTVPLVRQCVERGATARHSFAVALKPVRTAIANA